ncbi:NAD(P)-dependent alcohol dehydrogenase [Sinisalibacter aestuarii]|uniref:NADPH:quinone reductase n=1 Tax=Sinisalibacter aestuarii TaxID=2949426 RepID=A0ABQ5LV05_9RHOB|nr:NAD(P)-dependent alcohol dehydrogenase [Sinisalibacter aestuarii]GKY88823.1 NADPH:quinone reductase [Sinisalibacter aestuarii]
MRTLVCRGYGAGENLTLENRPVPEPGPGEVRVRVLACGANASDWEFVTGRPAYARIARWFWRRRDVFGSDVVGVVDKLGPGVTGFRPGQRVVADTFETFGGFADFCVARARLWVPVPEGVSEILAAALPQSGTIALTTFQGRVRPGMRVLVNGGGGGSGPLAIQIARAGGAEVWAVDTGAKAEVMCEAGADRVLDFEQQDFAAQRDAFDLILDLWGTRPMRRVRRTLKPGGRYMLVGGPLPVVIAAALATLWSAPTRRRAGILAVHQGPDALAELLAMVADGRLRPVVGEVTALVGAREALTLMGARQVAGKLVIVP